MKRIILTALLTLFVSLVWTQNILPQALLEKCFEITHEKDGNGRFKGQILKDKRNGMGFFLYKGGDLFAGDFYRDNITGYGMLVSAGEVKNCKNCRTYVGNWKDGKKSGFGRCYSAEGIVIYQGQFEDDKPAGNYPSEGVNLQKNISYIEIADGNVFLGETKEGMPNGFGIVIFKNGDLWQSSFKDGVRKGIGLYQAYGGEWQTMNVKGEQCDVVSSSENYRNLDETRKNNLSSAFASSMNYFVDAAKSSAELIAEIKRAKEEKARREAAEAAKNAANNSVEVVEYSDGLEYENDNSSYGNGKTHTKLSRCTVCVGNGKCSGKNRCHGTGKCAYCQGTGFNYAANGHQYKCEVCKGNRKCKYCHGTGKCTTCNGTGRKS